MPFNTSALSKSFQHPQVVNDSPHPQLPFEFGLMKMNSDLHPNPSCVMLNDNILEVHAFVNNIPNNTPSKQFAQLEGALVLSFVFLRG